MFDLSSSLTVVLGRGPARKLADKLNLLTVEELLRHYPRKYENRGRMTDLARLEIGERVTVWATVLNVSVRRLGPGAKVRSVETVTVSDGTRSVECVFFNQHWLEHSLPKGSTAMFEGSVKVFNGKLQISSPTVSVLSTGPAESMLDLGTIDAVVEAETAKARAQMAVIEEFAGGIIPVYPLVEGLNQQFVQGCVNTVLQQLGQVDDPVPDVARAERGLVDLADALRDVHRPRSQPHLTQALERLRYDEALSVQLVLAQQRHRARLTPAEPCPRIPGRLLEAFDAALPFELTAGQQLVGEEIAADLSTMQPMNRLLQGEVGSGKTMVALRAMLQVIDNGRQAVLLAPTEVLASQHARSLEKSLGAFALGGELGAPDLAVKVTLLTGSLKTKARRQALLDIVSGQAGIIVGTHALLSEGVFFNGLGLIVVDEQHRFGVEQRNVLRERHPEGNPPHVLVMTATPIPRTVAMTVFGDLDISVLEGLPRGRSPIATTVVPLGEHPTWLDRAWKRVHEEVAKGHQVYIVCPKIGDDEKVDPEEETSEGEPKPRKGARKPAAAPLRGGDPDKEQRPIKAVVPVAADLAAGALRGLKLGVLHGRLLPEEKDATMGAFNRGELDVLIATTVIEVGVDVPNATMMVILDAERFGISQLHQLRGRVGRGSAPGLCLLVTEAGAGSGGLQRLEAVAKTTDGFELAEADLAQRREGDVLGTHQAGRSKTLRQLSLLEHREVIEQARLDAAGFIAGDPALSRWPGLAEMVRVIIDEDDQAYLEKG